MIYGLLLIAPINPWKSMLTIQTLIIALDYTDINQQVMKEVEEILR